MIGIDDAALRGPLFVLVLMALATLVIASKGMSDSLIKRGVLFFAYCAFLLFLLVLGVVLFSAGLA